MCSNRGRGATFETLLFEHCLLLFKACLAWAQGALKHVALSFVIEAGAGMDPAAFGEFASLVALHRHLLVD